MVEMVATEGSLLAHVPPGSASESPIVLPTHTGATPDIAEGVAFTVTFLVTRHAELNEYVIVTIPPDIPVTIPEPLPIAPIVMSELVHIPPGAASVNVVVCPLHKVAIPVMGAGGMLMFTGIVATAVPHILETE
jgi:hypothetical protein